MKSFWGIVIRFSPLLVRLTGLCASVGRDLSAAIAQTPPLPTSSFNASVMARWAKTVAFLPFLTPITVVAAVGQQTSWTGTWAMAPMRGDADLRLTHATLRQIVHTSVGGNELRVEISNVYGDQPLLITDAHVALWRKGASIIETSDHPVFFHGQADMTIPPGKAERSDPVALKTAVLSDLVVSFYIRAQSGPITYHPSAHRTGYIATGDVSCRTDLPDATSTASAYFLTGVEVNGNGIAGAVVTLGASITEGYSTADNTANRWSDVLAQRLARAGLHIGVLNEGISGNRLLAEGMGPDAEQRFERDVVERAGVRWVIFSDDPINDLGSTRPAPDAKALISATKRLIALAHAHHIGFLCSTLTPYQGANYWRPQDEIVREQFNTFLRNSGSGCDGVIDQDAATHSPERPAWFRREYDVGDHLHPNDLGHGAIANAVNLSLLR